jgi:hypothetical protein
MIRRTCDSRDRFLSRQIGHMNEGIIEGCVNVGDTEDEFSLCDLWPQRYGSLFPDYFPLLWWLYVKSKLHELLLRRVRKIGRPTILW